jgi:hypothetical protein
VRFDRAFRYSHIRLEAMRKAMESLEKATDWGKIEAFSQTARTGNAGKITGPSAIL